MNDDKKLSNFEDFMQNTNPFDDIGINLDTRYVDIGVGYNKKTGTKLSATIDLNSIGRMTEADMAAEEARYKKEVMELDLQRRRIINEKLAKGEPIEPLQASYNTQVNVHVQQQEPTPQPTKNEEETNADPINTLGAKAILDDDSE